MKKENLEKIKELVARWDVPLQLLLTMEETAELSVTCSKLLRGFAVSREQLVDKVADVYVMLQTMCMLYGITEEELDKVASAKLDKGLAVPAPVAEEVPQEVPEQAQEGFMPTETDVKETGPVQDSSVDDVANGNGSSTEKQ